MHREQTSQSNQNNGNPRIEARKAYTERTGNRKSKNNTLSHAGPKDIWSCYSDVWDISKPEQLIHNLGPPSQPLCLISTGCVTILDQRTYPDLSAYDASLSGISGESCSFAIRSSPRPLRSWIRVADLQQGQHMTEHTHHTLQRTHELVRVLIHH
jgi:hypothetical protein